MSVPAGGNKFLNQTIINYELINLLEVIELNLQKRPDKPEALAGAPKIRKGIIRKIYRDRFLLGLLFLPMLYYFIFNYIPMYGVIIAFMDYNPWVGFLNSEWVGFEHFISFMNSVYFVRVLRNTVLLSAYSLIFCFPVPIVFAILLNEISNKTFKKTVQTISYLPHFISTVVIVGLIVNFLSPSTGIVNMILEFFGQKRIHFLTRPEYFRSIYIIQNIWKTMGWSAIIYLAALSSIPQENYEAAIIDGATRFQRIYYITLPGIIPVISIMLILQIGHILRVSWETILLLYNPMIYETSDVINTFVYRRGLVDSDFSFATAVNLFQNVLGFILVIVANQISRKVTETGLW